MTEACSHCGRTDKHEVNPKNYCLSSTYRARMERDDVCFNCAFWSTYYDKREDKRIARVDGNHYYIEPDTTKGFIGCGGAEFKIKFNDGREVVSKNLWHQGSIPDCWKEKLPDNAKFVK